MRILIINWRSIKDPLEGASEISYKWEYSNKFDWDTQAEVFFKELERIFKTK